MLRRYYGGGSILAGVHRCFIVSYIRSSNLFFIAGVFPRLILCLFTLRFLAGVLRVQVRARPAPVSYPALIVTLAITTAAPVVYVALSHGTVSPLSADARRTLLAFTCLLSAFILIDTTASLRPLPPSRPVL